tara:strand:+ start:53 stop:475 length:423 start_codon:yes stop_codon:yes gene_type:complete
MRFISILFLTLISFPNLSHANVIEINCSHEDDGFQLNFELDQRLRTWRFVGSYDPETKKYFRVNSYYSVVEWNNDLNDMPSEIWAIDDLGNAQTKQTYPQSLSTYYLNLEKNIYLSNRTYPENPENMIFQGRYHYCYVKN